MAVSLVTGGAGFMGSHVARERLRRRDEVIVLDDLSGGFADNVPQGAEFVHGSFSDVELVNKLFKRHRFEFVFHLGAYAAEGLSHFIRRYNYENNTVGSMNLINAAVNHNTKCFVFTSSIAVYGAGQVPMSESMTPQPEDPYGISKYAVELDLHAANAMFGLSHVIFRPHNVYGENQNIGDRYRNVIGIFMNQLMQDLPMTVFGDGEQTRAFTHISDVAPIIADAVDNPRAQNEVFNVGAETPYSVNYLADTVAKAMKKPAGKVYLPPRKEVVHAFSSHAKTFSVFGRKASVTLEEGVARMAEWARRVGPRQTKPFQGIEVRKNLPASWASQAD